MTSPQRKTLEDYDANTDGDDENTRGNFFANNISPVGLRRRLNATKGNLENNNGKVEMSPGQTRDVHKTKEPPRAFPKGLYPFVHVAETDDVPLPPRPNLPTFPSFPDIFMGLVPNRSPPRTPSRSPSPQRDEKKLSPSDIEDVEEQATLPKEKRQRFDLENSIVLNNKYNDMTGSSGSNSGVSTFSDENHRPKIARNTGYGIGEGIGMEEGGGHDSDECEIPYCDSSDEDPLPDSDMESKEESVQVNDWFTKFHRSRIYVGKLVNQEAVQIAVIVLIALNSIVVGIATSKWIADKDEDDVVRRAFDNVDLAFLIVFTVEVSMQLYYYGLALFTDAWLVFDFTVVSTSWLSYAFGADANGQVVRSFRIFRATRLFSRVKPLRDLLLALGDVMPRLMAIFFLLMIIFYVFAVLFTELYGDLLEKEEVSDDTPDYFSNLQMSLFTCFQMMTMEWGEVCRSVMQVKSDPLYEYSWIFFIIYVFISGFIVFNLIVAVVVEAVATTEETIRALDGLDDNSPQAKLDEAQERVDLLQSHLNEMMNQQEQIQFMLEAMAGELLHLETERMRAKYRETLLREEIGLRKSLQKEAAYRSLGDSIPSIPNSVELSDRSSIQKKKKSKRWTIKHDDFLKSDSSDLTSSSCRAVKSEEDLHSFRKRESTAKPKRVSAWLVKPAITKENSGKSFGTNHSSESNESIYSHEAPRSVPTNRRTITLPRRSRSSERDSSRKKKAKDNWKKLLAVQNIQS
mmetsp:Transcript_25226/g.69567  ORF Transcript_25226/g.69567 Transcript_25226/m.69567 type:complete len:743 (+) Transcript_25226:432-2660(+)